MFRPLLLVGAATLVACALAAPLVAEQSEFKKGDSIVVNVDMADVQVSSKVVARVSRHHRLSVTGVSGDWLGVTVNGKQYAYPRYQFCNASDDIRQMFCDACDAVGVEWRRMNARNISVARRASVARLDEFIGPKR